jgi:hypothetical protein
VAEGAMRWRVAVLIWVRGNGTKMSRRRRERIVVDSLCSASMLGGRRFDQLEARRP